MSDILLNDILKIQNLDNVKVRFIVDTDKFVFKPLKQFNSEDETELCIHQYYNYRSKGFFKENEITIGFVRIEGDKWLLFHIGIVTKDLNITEGVGYEYKSIDEYKKYIGRIIVEYHNTSAGAMGLVKKATTDGLFDKLKLRAILDDTFDDDLFPGYENVCIDWETLNRIQDKPAWKTALENQKGVYLITDKSNGKLYVGSAYGDNNMLLGRWQAYIKNGHGGNIKLKKIDFNHIKKYFQYSILEIFQSKTEDSTIIKREHWWMDILQSRVFGYNSGKEV